MRSFSIALVACALTGCVLPPPAPPKPSLWQLESECAASRVLAEIQSCTRRRLDFEYGSDWRAAPQANVFLDFIGATADRVQRGEVTDADGRLAISTYASQQFQVVQTQQAAQAAQEAQQRAATTQLGLALMQQAYSQPVMPAPFAPMMAPIGTQSSMACGLAPLPPLGCRVGPCACDASGHNCRYQMLCN
jgi:hypothetical protein